MTGLARDGQTPVFQGTSGYGILVPYEEVLTQWLKSDSNRNKSEHRGTTALFYERRALGVIRAAESLSIPLPYAGGKRRIWRRLCAHALDMGEAFQSDWSSENAVIGSLRRRLDLACTKFAASRAFVLSAYYNQAHEMFF